MNVTRRTSLIGLVLLACIPVFAQIAPTVTHTQDPIDIFATGSLINSDYHGAHLAGYAFGADFMFRPWIGIEASFQFSFPRNLGRLPYKLSERELLFGPIVKHRIGRFTPYGQALAGETEITFPSTNFSDSEAGFALGAGVDYRFSRRFSVRLLDFKWIDRSPGSGARYPLDYNSGIVYHF